MRKPAWFRLIFILRCIYSKCLHMYMICSCYNPVNISCIIICNLNYALSSIINTIISHRVLRQTQTHFNCKYSDDFFWFVISINSINLWHNYILYICVYNIVIRLRTLITCVSALLSFFSVSVCGVGVSLLSLIVIVNRY